MHVISDFDCLHNFTESSYNRSNDSMIFENSSFVVCVYKLSMSRLVYALLFLLARSCVHISFFSLYEPQISCCSCLLSVCGYYRFVCTEMCWYRQIMHSIYLTPEWSRARFDFVHFFCLSTFRARTQSFSLYPSIGTALLSRLTCIYYLFTSEYRYFLCPFDRVVRRFYLLLQCLQSE